MIRIQRKTYTPPKVVQAVRVCLEKNLLNSIVENVQTVETAGQEVEQYDMNQSSGTNFNHDWSND